MKPTPFEYTAPSSLSEALEILAESGDDATVLAGGQSLLPMMALRLVRPDLVVDVTRIPELAGIEQSDVLGIGATTGQRRVERDTTVRRLCPLLAAALPFVAHIAIRNRGTVGGSLAHADPAAELPAVMLALDAEMVVHSRRGERRVPAGEFFVTHLTTSREPDELLTHVHIPLAKNRTGYAFQEISRRHGDFALIGCAAVVTLAVDGSVAGARLAFCGVADTPVRAIGAEELLRGALPDDQAWRAAAESASRELDPGSDLHASAAYRRHGAGVLARRTLSAAAASAATRR